MKPILVVAHVYYLNLWAEIQRYLENITVPYDLYVTTIKENKSLKDSVLTFNPSAHFEFVENRGYDVGPFIHILNQVDLGQYDYLIKLHTKRDVSPFSSAVRGLRSNKWRNCLCSFLSSKEKFAKCLHAFDKDKSLGMHADYHVIVDADSYDKTAKRNVLKWLKANNYPKMNYSFVAGTMFFARADIFKKIQSLKLSLSDFDAVSENKHKTQLAHIFERLFGYFVYENGYKLYDIFTPLDVQQKYFKNSKLKDKIKQILRPVYQKKVTASGCLVIKIFKIPVYRRKHVSTD